MRHEKIKRDIAKIKDDTNKALEDKVNAILGRFSLCIREEPEIDWDYIVDNVSEYELKVLDEWMRPQIADTVKHAARLIIHPFTMAFIEDHVWRYVLHINPEDDDEYLLLHFDHLYAQCLDPPLWDTVFDAMKQAPAYGEPSWDTWTIPKELSDQYKDLKKQVNARKDEIRRKMWAECVEDVILLREEGSHELANAIEEELKTVGVIVTQEGEAKSKAT